MNSDSNDLKFAQNSISTTGRYLVLATVFLGWLFAGVQMSITSLAMRSASIDLLSRTGSMNLEKFDELNKKFKERKIGATRSDPINDEERQVIQWREMIARWYAWYICAFLFGAAAGGLIFGRMGDRIGRSKAMAASILCYSLFSGAAYFVESPLQLLLLRFVTCMGVGGMWPNGVALVSEAWAKMSRPMVAGVIGAAANVGIFLMATIAASDDFPIKPVDWRWVMWVGAAPALLALFVLAAVPESPRWLAARDEQAASKKKAAPAAEVFRSPFLKVTILGILLATVPLMGGWGSANWMVPWAGEAGDAAGTPELKAHVVQARSLTGILGSFLGGWIGSFLGRRRTYFLISLAALGCAQYAFWFTTPTDVSFLYWVGALGFFSGIYFGWLPLFLPELFPTRVRSTGAGVSFNFGRILTGLAVLATGAMMVLFAGDYAQIGRVTSLVFLFGMIVIWFAPDTSKRQIED